MLTTDIVIHVTRLFGMLPVRKLAFADGKIIKFEVSKRWMAYSILMFISCVGATVAMIGDAIPVLMHRNDGDLDTSTYADLADVFVISLAGLIIYLLCVRQVHRIANGLTEVMNINVNETSELKPSISNWLNVGIPTVFWFFLVIHDLFDTLRRHMSMAIYIPHLSYYFLVYYRVGMETQFVSLCLEIGCRFLAINNLIEEMQHRINLSGRKTSHFEAWVAQSLLAPALTQSDRLKMLQKLRNMHDQLSDIGESVGEAYGSPILLDLAAGVMNLTVNLYLGIGMCLYGNTEYTFITFLFVWAAFYAGRFIILSSVVAFTTSEALRTNVLLQKVNQRSLDTESKEEIHMFTQHLNARRLEFSASGFFPLDFTLLYAIVGAVTTYLVILLQFQSGVKMSEPGGDELQNITATEPSSVDK